VSSDDQTGNTRRKEARGKRLAFLSLAALGVVYGDIGTSPLYAIRECFHGTYAIEVALLDRAGTAPDTDPLVPLYLGIEGRGADGWYAISELTVE